MAVSLQLLQSADSTAHWKLARRLTRKDRFTIDKFKKYRSSEAEYALGVSMYVSHAVELKPSHAEGPRASNKTIHYVYDLELDANMNIVGGEWYSEIHPDFIWAPKNGARATSVSDPELRDRDQWTGSQAMPSSWTQSARAASVRLQPLAAVVERLVQLSSGGTTP